jgi:signal recognition particle subunit SRP54
MFESLSNRLGGIFSSLSKRGSLSEKDIDTAMREVRIALLEADVALPVVKEFIKSLKEKALGAEIIKNVNPAQMVIKLVQDHLEELLGSETAELNLRATPPVVILMCGLQGSGKTTSSGKLALRLKQKENKKVILASLDTQRPAAQEQLEILAGQVGVDSLPIVKGENAVTITKRALKEAKLGGQDVLILDTAGRLHLDGELMEELIQVRDLAQPTESLLVADALTGQDAVTIAREFQEKIGLTGIILTRIDGDGRGGAALSMRQVTGQPIKFMGTGEKPSEFEPFHPERIASRILDMGDVVSLVEKAAENIDAAEAEAMARKLQSGQFDFNDLNKQLNQMNKMGGLGSMMKMLPGIGKLKGQLDAAGMDDSVITKQQAIIGSMTKKERENPKLLNGSRKKRIAAGAGVDVPEVNKLIKAQAQMQTMMKKMKKMGGGKKGMMKMMQQMGGMPDMGAMGGGAAAGGMPDLSQLGAGKAPGGLPPELAKLLKK